MSANRQGYSWPLAALFVATVIGGAHATANLGFKTNAEARRRLLQEYLGEKPVPVQIETERSDMLNRQVNGSFDGVGEMLEPDGDGKRGLRVAFFEDLDPTRTEAEVEYIMGRLMPATAAVLARSIRVRNPSGPLPLAGFPDETGQPIPGDPAGIDADIVIKVTSMPANSPACAGLLAGATAFLIEQVTLRPIYGFVMLCSVDEDDFDNNLVTTVHELLHALVVDPDMFNNFPGYPNGISDIVQVFDDGRAILTTPNVVQSVREHFACDTMLGAELEDDGGPGSRRSHWEQRVFEGEMMDAVGGRGDSHHFRHVLTDLTLAIIQDSGWYDVKYGSQGFNVFGYLAGCEFALGSYQEALSTPQSARYLCPEGSDLQFECLHDYSGDGVCFMQELWDGFARSLPIADSNFDCQARSRGPGQRCINRNGESLSCVDMSCAADGTVLVNGEPCDPGEMKCPDEQMMCGDPGLLTCLGDLNDCSGQGDCLRGNCYCHTGYGGADCSVPVCLSAVGCPDGTACPTSGFCGVAECGTWSSGMLDRGIACNGATGAAPQTDSAQDGDDGVLSPAQVNPGTVPVNFQPPGPSDDGVADTDLPGDVVGTGDSTFSFTSAAQRPLVAHSWLLVFVSVGVWALF